MKKFNYVAIGFCFLVVGLIFMSGCNEPLQDLEEIFNIISRSPALNATGVSQTADLSLTFNFPVNASVSLNDLFAAYGNNHTAGTPDLSTATLEVSNNNKTLTVSGITGWSNLTNGAGPKVVEVVAAQDKIKDMFDNAIFANNTLWKYTLTGIGGVASVSPANGATGVARDTQISVTFSESMDASTINTNTFTVTASTVTGTVSYDAASKTASFTPDSNLGYSKTYTATVAASIADTNGNTLGSDYSWSFTTVGIAAPGNLAASATTLQTIVSWDAVVDASSYNLYWSTSAGVTKANGTKITGATSPYTHTGRVNGQIYYYVSTAVDAQNNESADSSQASATPTTIGTLDASFSGDGVAIYPNSGDLGYSMALDSSGRILVTGSLSNDMAILRYNTDGTLDTSFSGDGVVTDNNAGGGNGADLGNSIALDSSGKIVVSGDSDRDSGGSTDYLMAVWRYDTGGSLDTGFAGDGIVTYESPAGGANHDRGYGVTVDASDNVLVAGSVHNGTDYDLAVWRYTTAGSLDASFGVNGVVIYDGGNGWDWGKAIVLDSSGKILVAGSSSNGTDRDMAIWRYNSDGTTDESFGTSGVAIHNNAAGGSWHDNGNAITLDSSGRILVAGDSVSSSPLTDMVIWRYNSDGTLDTSFGANGVVVHNNAAGGNDRDYGFAITTDSSGKILVAGYSDNDASGSTDYDVVIWRYNSDGTLDTSFGVNGMAIYDGGDNDFGESIAIDSSGRILVAGTSSGLKITVWRYK